MAKSYQQSLALATECCECVVKDIHGYLGAAPVQHRDRVSLCQAGQASRRGLERVVGGWNGSSFGWGGREVVQVVNRTGLGDLDWILSPVLVKLA